MPPQPPGKAELLKPSLFQCHTKRSFVTRYLTKLTLSSAGENTEIRQIYLTEQGHPRVLEEQLKQFLNH